MFTKCGDNTRFDSYLPSEQRTSSSAAQQLITAMLFHCSQSISLNCGNTCLTLNLSSQKTQFSYSEPVLTDLNFTMLTCSAHWMRVAIIRARGSLLVGFDTQAAGVSVFAWYLNWPQSIKWGPGTCRGYFRGFQWILRKKYVNLYSREDMLQLLIKCSFQFRFDFQFDFLFFFFCIKKFPCDLKMTCLLFYTFAFSGLSVK